MTAVADKDVTPPAPPIVLRPSNDNDVPAMLDIYRHHIAHGVGNLGTFEPTPFDAEDLKARRKNMRKHRLPHLVATIDGAVAGCAYGVLFRKRPAYRFTVKHSIYVYPDRLHMGVGRALLPASIEASAFGRLVICTRWPFGSANGQTPCWFSGRSARRYEPLGSDRRNQYIAKVTRGNLGRFWLGGAAHKRRDDCTVLGPRR